MSERDFAELHDVASNSIINISYVRDTLEMKTRQEFLNRHPYTIYQGKDGKWYTYLPDKQKGRLFKRRTTKEQIENLVVDYWRNEEENPTIGDVFKSWNDRRLHLGKISASSYERYQDDFNRYFSELRHRRIKSVTPEAIEDFLDEQIFRYQLTAKAFGNLRTVTKGMLKYAKRKRYISFAVEQLFEDLDISDRDFKKIVKEDYEEVYDDDEKETMMTYLSTHLDLQNLGILIMFVTGLRIGELVALKHCDVFEGGLKVRRTETRFRDENDKTVYCVKDYPKSKAGVRMVVFPSNYAWLEETLRNTSPDSDYIFCKKGKRITTNSVRSRLRRLCDKLEIYPKSPHKVRKTYGSILLDNNIDKRLVTELMGHSSILVTENCYHRNRRSLEEKIAKISAIPELQA